MKKSIPFEAFGANQFIYFDIERLAMLEKISGVSVTTLATSTAATGVNFVLHGCIVGLAHHYHKATREDYIAMIETYLENGGSLSKLEVDLGRAIVASGIYGKDAADKAMKLDIREDKSESNDPNAQKSASE